MVTAPGDLSRAVERELDTYGARDTTAGQTALALARSIDDGPESATGLAALSRELRATMTETLSAHANTSGGFLPELKTRREQRRQALTWPCRTIRIYLGEKPEEGRGVDRRFPRNIIRGMKQSEGHWSVAESAPTRPNPTPRADPTSCTRRD